MKHCFIIQPFDNDRFDKRFVEIIEPVVTECGYLPYRVDKDESADVLIDAIEKKITTSECCIADITTNNPNVWYELGYASAQKKKVIMICSEERGEEPFPFDVRHRNILVYKTKAPSDFEQLKYRLKQRILGSNSKSSEPQLSTLDRLLLSYIYNNLNTPNEVVPKEKIKIHGVEDISAALKKLVNGGYLEYIYSVNNRSIHKNYYRVTEKAITFILTEKAMPLVLNSNESEEEIIDQRTPVIHE